MQLDLVEMGSSYSDVLVVSGSGVFVPAFRALKNMWPSIQCHIAAFPTTLHKAYMEERDRDIVDTVINLDERVIYRNGSKKDNSKKSSEE